MPAEKAHLPVVDPPESMFRRQMPLLTVAAAEAARERHEGLGRLADWMEAVCERESCVESLPPPAELVESFGKMVERMKTAAK